jgi:hypothetical protein
VAALVVTPLGALTACGGAGSASSAAGAAATPPAAANPAAGSASPAGAPAAATPASASAGATQAASAAAGGAINVCSLMSSAQASAINQVTYGAATPKHASAGYDICTYANTGTHADPVDIQQLTVTVISLSGCYAELQQADGPGTPVAGLGHAAFGYQIGIVVNDGSRCIDVSGLTHAELQNDYAHDTAMAKIIMTALG